MIAKPTVDFNFLLKPRTTWRINLDDLLWIVWMLKDCSVVTGAQQLPGNRHRSNFDRVVRMTLSIAIPGSSTC
jgi:hypothetical protein